MYSEYKAHVLRHVCKAVCSVCFYLRRHGFCHSEYANSTSFVYYLKNAICF